MPWKYQNKFVSISVDTKFNKREDILRYLKVFGKDFGKKI